MIESLDDSEKNKKKTDSGTPVLDNFSKDLNKLAEQGKLDSVIVRKKEIYRIAQILSRRKKNNPIIAPVVSQLNKNSSPSCRCPIKYLPDGGALADSSKIRRQMTKH